jgi:peroxiredoxin family protein
MSEEKKKKLAMIVFSGDLDKLFSAFVIATGAAASGMEVVMFFTFWGLRALKKKAATGRSLFGRVLGLATRGGIDKAPPSKMSYGGIGRWIFRKMMRAKRLPSLVELRQSAIDLGVKLVGCQTSMEVMEIPREKMIDQVAACVGVAYFIEQAQESSVTLFI